MHANESETFGEPAPQIHGRERCPLCDALDFLEELCDCRNRRGKVAPEIGAAGDAFIGLEIDEQQRRTGDGAAAGAERVGHRHFDPDAPDCANDEERRM